MEHKKHLLAKLLAINKTVYSLPPSRWLCVSLTEHANRETKSYNELSFKNKDVNLISQKNLFAKAKSISSLISCKCKYYLTSFSFHSCREGKLNIRI